MNRRPTFVLKLQSLRGDGIRGLRHVLKRLLRDHKFRCVSAREEQPPIRVSERDTSVGDEFQPATAQSMEIDVHKHDALPPKYLSGTGVSEGWTLTAEIEMSRMEKFDNNSGQTEKLVVYFRRQRSGLVCGSVVWDQLVAATGEEDSDRWKGHTVELYRTTCQFGPKTVPCIRVRKADAPKKPVPKKVTVEAEANDEIPF